MMMKQRINRIQGPRFGLGTLGKLNIYNVCRGDRSSLKLTHKHITIDFCE